MRHKRGEGAFTLVEVMIVVGIIALLAAVIIPNLVRGRTTANEAAAKATLKSISTAMENYMAINTEYPTTTTALLGDTPPYLNTDYFNGAHNGYTFTPTLGSYSYAVLAAPASTNQGTVSYTISTGGVLAEN